VLRSKRRRRPQGASRTALVAFLHHVPFLHRILEEIHMYSDKLLAASLITAFASAALAHDDDAAQRTRRDLGRVLFKTSCTAEAQQQFDRALAMLHSFYFPETVKAFNAIPETDPACAIAYWGIAISQRPNPLVGPFDAATLKRGLEAIEKGEAIGAKTQRERDWLAALKEFYKDYDKVDQDTRTRNYEKAMGALSRKYPRTWRPRCSTRWRSTRPSITSRWRRWRRPCRSSNRWTSNTLTIPASPTT
jgi:hypothetical protein